MSESSDESNQSEILENEPQVELQESEESEEEEEEEQGVEQISDENIDLDFNQGEDDISEELEEAEEVSLDIDKLNSAIEEIRKMIAEDTYPLEEMLDCIARTIIKNHGKI